MDTPASLRAPRQRLLSHRRPTRGAKASRVQTALNA
jgi:hypothetical protein